MITIVKRVSMQMNDPLNDLVRLDALLTLAWFGEIWLSFITISTLNLEIAVCQTIGAS